MFEEFCDYMYYLLTSPFKKVKKALNQWYILFKVLGKRYDDAMESIYNVMEQTMLATCDPVMLPVHAEDRKMTQYSGEEDENFRVRIANYPEVLRLGGSDAAVLLAVKTLGYEEPELIKANVFTGRGSQSLENGEFSDRWAEFYIVINMDVDDKHPISMEVLKKEVRKVKSVGAKDNYSFQYKLEILGFSDFQTVTYHYYELEYLYWLDGSWILDGSVELGAYRNYEEVIEVSEIIKTKCYAKKEAQSRITGNISPIKYIALGTGAGETGLEKKHLAEDVQLFNELLRKEAVDIIQLDDTTYKFSITLAKDEAIGAKINEIALIDSDDDVVLFSTFLTKTKEKTEDTYTVIIS